MTNNFTRTVMPAHVQLAREKHLKRFHTLRHKARANRAVGNLDLGASFETFAAHMGSYHAAISGEWCVSS